MGSTQPAALHWWKYIHYMVGAVAALAVMAVLSLPYFRPNAVQATRGPSTVVCGSTSPLVATNLKTFNYGGSNPASTQTLVSCSSPYGGITDFIALRRSSKVDVTYHVYVDGSSSPLLDIYHPTNIGPGQQAGWIYGDSMTTSVLPIKFTSSLVITADVPANTSAKATQVSIGGHVMFTPSTPEEVPVKFLTPQPVDVHNSPTVNIGNTPFVNIIGQPIHTVTP